MAASAFMEQVRRVIVQRRVHETQSRSEPAGAFQSLIAHSIMRDAFRSRKRVEALDLHYEGHKLLPFCNHQFLAHER